MLEIGIWAGGEGAGERERERPGQATNMLTLCFQVVAPEIILVAICTINEPVMLHAGPLQVRGRLFYVVNERGTAVSATALTTSMVHILGCAWLRATG